MRADNSGSRTGLAMAASMHGWHITPPSFDGRPQPSTQGTVPAFTSARWPFAQSMACLRWRAPHLSAVNVCPAPHLVGQAAGMKSVPANRPHLRARGATSEAGPPKARSPNQRPFLLLSQ